MWYRKKGEHLRPNAFTEADISRLKTIINPDFEALTSNFSANSVAGFSREDL